MTKIDRRIVMDQTVWDQLDSEAARTGRSTDELLEDVARRDLASHRIRQLLDAAAAAALPETEADAAARAEVDAYRRSR